MLEKFDIYDLLSVIVPGVLLVLLVALCFPLTVTALLSTKLPELILATSLLTLAILAGHIIQAIASLIEPPLFFLMGGKPSDRALEGKLSIRYLPADVAQRVRNKLEKRLGPATSSNALFLQAMQLGESSGSKASRFNALYAYHRSLLVFMILALAIFIIVITLPRGPQLEVSQEIAIITINVLLIILFFWRMKQRGIYYAREVLLAADAAITKAEEAATLNSSIAARTTTSESEQAPSCPTSPHQVAGLTQRPTPNSNG